MDTSSSPKEIAFTAAQEIAGAFAQLERVQAVCLGGSWASGQASEQADIDLYVYARPEPTPEQRAAIARPRAQSLELDNRYWEPGDEWIESGTGLAVDVMYRTPEWVEEQLERVLVRHQPSVGYSTCFWDNVLNSVVLFDREGWFSALQARARRPYPEPLRRAIIAFNYPLLRDNQSAYAQQIAKAVERDDVVSVNHRVAAFLASYFDILFALNRVPHPGEKRLLTLAEQRCPLRPPHLRRQVEHLLRVAASDLPVVEQALHTLVDELDELLEKGNQDVQDE